MIAVGIVIGVAVTVGVGVIATVIWAIKEQGKGK